MRKGGKLRLKPPYYFTPLCNSVQRMSNPRGYPDDIELKVDKRVGGRADDTALTTDNQFQQAEFIEEVWPIDEFSELADGKDWSRQAITDTLTNYFGPAGDDITFREIEEDYGGWEHYERRRKEALGVVDLDDEIDYTERELDLIIKATQDGFESGYGKGYQAGWEAAMEGREKDSD